MRRLIPYLALLLIAAAPTTPTFTDLANSFATAAVSGSYRTMSAWVGYIDALVFHEVSVRQFGAQGDGVTNDSPYFAAAIAALPHGGTVVVPATGHAYLLNTGVTVSSGSGGSGVTLKGDGGMYWPGPYDNTEAHWTAFGSYIHCADTVNACLTLAGNGSSIRGLNFWYTQPTPGGSTCGATCTFTHGWTPTAFPATIAIVSPQNFNSISDITVVNGYTCLDIEGANSGVSTIYTNIEHVHLGCVNVVTKMQRIDNTVSIHDYRDQLWWFQFNSDLVGYTEGDSTHAGHKIGLDCYYCSGLQMTDVEFYQDAIGIRGTDQTVNSGLGGVTFAVQAGQWANISFNQTCQAITVAASTTHFSARLTNVILNVDPQTSGIAGQCGSKTNQPYAFNLNSDNADVSILNLDGYLAQSLGQVGGGTSGGLHIGGNVRISYSAYGTGSPAFTVNAGGVLDMPSTVNALFPASGAGPICSGSGCRDWPSMAMGDTWIQGPSGTAKQLNFVLSSSTGTYSTQWGVVDDTSGNFALYRYNTSTGVFIDSPFGVNNSTGQIFFYDGAGGNFPTSCTSQPTGTIWNSTGTLKVC